MNDVVLTVDGLRAVWPDLRGRTVVGLDVRAEPLDWRAALVRDTTLLGCVLPRETADVLTQRDLQFNKHSTY